MSSFDVRVFAVRRRPGRKAFEVRWRVAGRDRSRSFMTRALAGSYHAELVRAARRGRAFDPATGEPAAWATPEPTIVTWYRQAAAYAEMKWPRLAPHSRASLADALATITPLLTRETSRRPPDQTLRAALYGYAFNPQRRRSGVPDPGTASALAWLERASLPVCQLSNPEVIRTALNGLCARLDGSPAAANTISRKRAAFHGALGYAAELRQFGAAPDGRLFPGTRGGMLSEPVCGRAWHAARHAALSPELAATPLARRLYDLRHAALSLWLNAAGEPAEVAARAGNSARVLYEVYLHCTDGQDDTVSQRIEDALDAATGTTHSPPHAKASGYTHCRHHPTLSATCTRTGPRSRARPTATWPARPATPHAGTRRHQRSHSSGGMCGNIRRGRAMPGSGPRIAHGTEPTVFVTSRSARRSR